MIEVELNPKAQSELQFQFQPKLKRVPKLQLQYNP